MNDRDERMQQITVGCKVTKDVARYWTVQAKMQRRPVAEVIRMALITAFGLPEYETSEIIERTKED
jgi:hypothetical protein